MQEDLEGNEVKVTCEEELKTSLIWSTEKLTAKMSEDQAEKMQAMKSAEKRNSAIAKKVRIKRGIRAITAEEYSRQEEVIISAVINGI